MMLVLFLCFTAVFAQTTVLDVLKQQRATTLISLIDNAGLTDVLKGTGPFTIFAPTNRAFSKLDSNTTAALTNDKVMLANVLKNHVVGANLRYADIRMNEKKVMALSNKQIRFNHYLSTGGTTANGARMYTTDHTSSNGVVHTVTGILTPPAGTVLELAKADPELSTLVAAVTAAGLGTFLNDQDPITVFAPTNAAFAKLGSAVPKILADKDLLKTILTYHVIPGSLYTAGYHSASLHTFDEADQLRLHKFLFFGYEVDDSSVTVKDISAKNGVVHKIDSVLVPGSVKAKVTALLPIPTTPTPTV